MHTIKGKVAKIFFPKADSVGNGDFYIFALGDVTVLEGDEKKLGFTKYNTLSVQGNMSECIEGNYVELKIDFHKADPSFGTSYKIVEEVVSFELNNEKDLKAFIYSLDLTDNQANTLLLCDNIIEHIKTGNTEELIKLKGIGEYTANRIIGKYEASKDMQKYYEYLYKIGVENYAHRVKIVKHFLNKADNILKNKYKNETIPVEEINKLMMSSLSKIKDNPYILMEIDGFGLKTVDEIAVNYIKIPYDSVFRLEKFAEFILEEHGNCGRSYLYLKDFIPAFKKEVEEVKEGRITIVKTIRDELLTNTLLKMQKDEKIYISKDGSKIALKYFYDLELNISNELKRIQENVSDRFIIKDSDLIIKDVEIEQGFEFSDEQKDAINTMIDSKNGVVVLTGFAGCVDMDTEFFTGTGWKKISEYEEGDKVLQYNLDGTAELVSPLRYIKTPCSEFNFLTNKTGSLNQMICDEHRVIYKSTSGILSEISAKELTLKQDTLKHGFTGKFITTFSFSGQGVDISDEYIRVMVMVMADGCFNKKGNTNWCEVKFTKERKKERAIYLLEKANIPYKIYHYKDYLRIRFYAPIKTKTFPIEWYDFTSHQFEVVLDELVNWDGSSGHKKSIRYFTNNKSDVDFIQFACASLGIRATFYVDNRERRFPNGSIHKTHNFCVRINRNTSGLISLGNEIKKGHKPPIKKIPSKDGYKYCFTVPSSMLVLRREGRIFITGNCGKTTVTNAVHRVFEGFNTWQGAFSGKASQRMAEVTGKEASTIHMHLAKFKNTEDRDLNTYDIYIIDEASMIHLELMLSLLQTIPNGAKLFILGDVGQLQALTTGNLLTDIINSNSLPVAKLTKVYRQGMASGILSTSVKVRNQEQLCKYKENKDVILGEKQDLRLITRDNSLELEDLILQSYADYYKESENVLDIQVLTPLNSKGSLSTVNLNAKIQNLLSPYLSETYFECGNLKFHIGDKVVCTKNNYKAKTEEEDITSVFNGSLGLVVDFIRDCGDIVGLLIDFIGIGRVKYLKEDCSKINLAYALTVHKCQGSEFKNIIYTISTQAYNLLNKENVYTGITRAKKHCTVIAESTALHKAISTSEINSKLTFLENMLST